MSFGDLGDDLLSTPQAATLVARHESSLKHALADGKLAGVRTFAGWRIRREDVIAWDRHASGSGGARPPGTTRLRSLAGHGPATATEVAGALGIHVGNARKHLAILAKHGRAKRGRRQPIGTSSHR